MNLEALITTLSLIFHFKHKKEELSSFDQAITYVLKHEGGLSEDKDDRGGLTNYGLSYNYLSSLTKKEPIIIKEIDLNYNDKLDNYDVKNMTLDEAKHIYFEEWWEKYGYGKLNYQPLATKLLDMSVNMGPYRPIQWLRQSCNKIFPSKSLSISDHEAMIINNLSKIEKDLIIKKLEMMAIDFYKSLAKNNPSQQKYLSGWLKRITDKF